MNIVVEGRDRFKLLELTSGRSFQTGDVVPVEDGDDPAEPESVDRALLLFERLKDVTGSEVEVPSPETLPALVLARGARRAGDRRQARAARGGVGGEAHRARVRAARARGSDRRAPARGGRAGRHERPRPHRVGGRPGGQGYDATMAVTARPKLDAHRLRADFPIFEQVFHGKPLAFLDSAASSQKPRQMLDAMQRLLRDVVRQRPSRCLRARRARHGGPRARAREGTRAPERARRARGDLRPERDRGDQPRVVRLGAPQSRARRPRRRLRARAPLELRPLAVRRDPHRCRLPDDLARRERRAPPGRPRRDRGRGQCEGRGDGRRVELARYREPGRAAVGLGARARRDHGRRRARRPRRT